MTCGFHDCYYNWIGHKIDEETDENKKCTGDIWKRVDDKFEYYNPEKSGETEWSDLQIITIESYTKRCVICIKHIIVIDTNVISKPCDHQYHKDCFKKLENTLKRDCPACLEH